jgi:hypothetical protein
LPVETDVTVSVTGEFTQLKNLVTGEMISGQPPVQDQERWRREVRENRTSFTIHLPPHSYSVFAAEK